MTNLLLKWKVKRLEKILIDVLLDYYSGDGLYLEITDLNYILMDGEPLRKIKIRYGRYEEGGEHNFSNTVTFDCDKDKYLPGMFYQYLTAEE